MPKRVEKPTEEFTREMIASADLIWLDGDWASAKANLQKMIEWEPTRRSPPR